MLPPVTERLQALPEYALAMGPELRQRLEARGVDVINVGAGDPDLPPPPQVIQRLQEVVTELSYSKYPFQSGLMAYREAVAAFMEKRFGATFDPVAEILPLIGSKDGIAHFPIGFLEQGNVGIIPDPGYPPYLGGVTLSGGIAHPVPLRPENDFLIPLGEIRGDIVARAKLLYLNYPNNPTTACAPLEYLEEAVAFCARHGMVLLYDNAYSEVAFDGYRPPSIFEVPGAREVAVEFHSFSKTFNMTGWRLGWAAGNPELIGALKKVKTWVDTGGFLAVQAAGIAALESYDEWVPGNVAHFQARRDAAVAALRDAGFQLETPKATMYVWPRVPEGETSAGFAGRALEEKGVILMPGSAMGSGGEGFFRIALTVFPQRLAEVAERLGELLA
jgi:LL-diaminopimelate aminotransferase